MSLGIFISLRVVGNPSYLWGASNKYSLETKKNVLILQGKKLWVDCFTRLWFENQDTLGEIDRSHKCLAKMWRVGKLWPIVPIPLLLVFVTKVLRKHSQACTFSDCVCFHATMAELSSCDRDSMALCRKSWPSSALCDWTRIN